MFISVSWMRHVPGDPGLSPLARFDPWSSPVPPVSGEIPF